MSESQMIHPAQPAPTATRFTPGAAKDTLDSTELQVFPVQKFTPAEGGAPADAGNVEWNIILLKGEGFGELRRVSVRRGDNAVVAFGKVKADISFPNRITSLLHQILYFGDKAIFEASITWRIEAGDEAQQTFVDVGPLTYDPLLTAALHGRFHFHKDADFVTSNLRFAQDNKAMVIAWKINKKYTVGCILFACALSIGLGVIVGLVCHDAGLGVGVGSAAAAILAVVAFILMKLAK
ncbi:hypothetical protein LTS15_009124 [Exophiala xenobiotica]|nr:hypothetical protein LTS15_009124 [Exophiala xenobiotica]